jgi:hypothetical protein
MNLTPVQISCRTLQEGKSPLGNDYLLKPQTGGGGTDGGGGTFLDHTNMSFHHGGKNIESINIQSIKYLLISLD